MTTRTAKLTCPGCGVGLDGHDGVTVNGPPADGDVTICFDCGEIAVFDAGVTRLREPTNDEMLDIRTSETWAAVREVRDRIKNRRAGR